MDVKLPKLGEGADSGVVVSVLVKEGDTVEEGQTIIELENEKAVAPVPSTASGTVTKIRVKEGDKLTVGQVILTVDGGGQAPKGEKPEARELQGDAAKKPTPAAPEVDNEQESEDEVPGKAATEPVAAPSVRRLARELGIDLVRVRGRDPGGRIIMDDLRTYIQRLQKREAQPTAADAPGRPKSAVEPIDFSKWGPITRKPLSQLRKVIGQRMSESWSSVPRVTQFDEADITALMELRKKHQNAYEARGARLTLTPLVLKAVATILEKHAIFRSSLDEAAGEIVFKEYCHIGLAVDTEAGLVVPVVRDVDKKGMVELAKEVEQLAARARERKLALDEMKGATFTVSNQGGVGGGHFTPIVNRPEVAILGLGRGSWKAVVKDKKIVPRLMLPLAVSYDHRVIDGAMAARFVVDLVKGMEEYSEALMME